jgi:putative ABC transport system substrate-binding protein
MRLVGLAVVLTVGLMLPPTGEAQPAGKVWRIAIVAPAATTVAKVEGPVFKSLLSELRQLGYVEGQNLVLERWAGRGRSAQYPDLARAVVQVKPDLIIAGSAPIVGHLKRATTTIPIVAFTSGDPIAQGLVVSLARPGGNITGVSVSPDADFQGKYLELLREVVPTAKRVALLVPRRPWESGLNARMLRDASQRLGVTLVGAVLEDPIQEPEYRRAFAALTRDRVNAVIVGDYVENFQNMRVIVDLAAQARLPTVALRKDFVEAGALISYGAYIGDQVRIGANYIDRILRGANPGELPYQLPTKFELAINLKTAKALGLTIPQSVLVRASEIIR